MHSWRDSLDQAAQADLDRLLDSALSQAQQAIVRVSEFDPFAIVTDLDGRILRMELDTAQLGKHPDSLDILNATAAQLRTLGSSSRCTAIIANTRLAKERTDALEVRLEHKVGAALLVLLPYKRPRFGGTIEYGQLSAFNGQRDVWA